MSEMAILDLRMRWLAFRDGLRKIFGRPMTDHTLVLENVRPVPVIPRSMEPESSPVEPDAFRWRRHPLLRSAAAKSGLSPKEQRARRLAVQGLYAGLRGDSEQAMQFFTYALSEAPIDLCGIPSFWQMPRGAIVAAADAYEADGRLRDATALRARIRAELRPRNVVQLRPVDVLPERQQSAGGS